MKIYENVHVCDFHALYPSLILQMRLSPENEYSINYTNDSNTNLVIDKSEFNEDHGLLDGYITELLDLRKKYRKQGKESEQLAVKIIANSVYGLLSQKTTKFILGGTHIASTVTYTGRTILQTLVKELPKYEIKVVYGKTDSIFVIDLKNNKSKTEVLEIAQSLVDEIVKDLTGFDNQFINFDYEEFLAKFLVVNRNNYVKQYNDNNRKMKGASFYNSKSSQFEVDLMNYILDNLLDGSVFYKRDVELLAIDYMCSKLISEPLSYFAIKHKPRQLAVNKWDSVEYMVRNNMNIEYGFYHYAAIVNGMDNYNDVLVYPLNHEPDSKYTVNKTWVKSIVNKTINKLNLNDRALQTSLDKYF